MDGEFAKVLGSGRGQTKAMPENAEQRAARVSHDNHHSIYQTLTLCGAVSEDELSLIVNSLVTEYASRPREWHSTERDQILFANSLASHIALLTSRNPKKVFQALWGKEYLTRHISNGDKQMSGRVSDLFPFANTLELIEWFQPTLPLIYAYCIEGYEGKGNFAMLHMNLRDALVDAVQNKRLAR